MTKKGFLLLSIIFVSFLFINTQAKTSSPLKVGLVYEAPFVIQGLGENYGVSVSIWEIIAKRQGLPYQFIPLGKNIDDGIAALKSHQIDVLIGPLVVTSPLIGQISFSRPYFINDLALATLQTDSGFWGTLLNIVKNYLVIVLICYALLALIFTLIIWWCERKTLTQQHVGFFRQFGFTLWNTVSVLFSLHYTRPPQSIYGRLFSSFWLLVGLSFIAFVSAATTSALTIAHSNLVVESIKETSIKGLAGENFAVIEGSYSAYLSNKLGAHVTPVSSFSQAVDLLKARKVDAILDNYVTFRYEYRYHKLVDTKLNIRPIETSEMAFGFQKGSSLVESVDKELTLLQDAHLTRGICEKYLDHEDGRFCNI